MTDEDGVYCLILLLFGAGYVVTFYYNDLSVARQDITVGLDQTTPLDQKIETSAAGHEGITLDNDYMMGLPPETHTFEGLLEEKNKIDIKPEAEHRPVIEWSSWARIGVGTES